MTPLRPDDHERWEQLAAGHALHALEPQETDEFERHAATCARCRVAATDHALVASELGLLSVDAGDDAPAWASIRRAVVGEPSPVADAAEVDPSVVSLSSRRRPGATTRLLAAAAAVVVLAGGGLLAWRVTRSAEPSVADALAACARNSACHEVRLHATHGGDDAAVVVTGRTATLVPLGLAPSPADRMYVLWQVPRDGRPTAVAEFHVSSNGRAAGHATMPLRMDQTAAFAVSDEKAGSIPPQPSSVVAVGTVSA